MKIRDIQQSIDQAVKVQQTSICLTIEIWPTSHNSGEPNYDVWLAKNAKCQKFKTLAGAVDYINALSSGQDDAEELTNE